MTDLETRALDAAVARALGVQVLGEALCSPYDHPAGDWHVERRQESGVLRPVYLGRCGCEDEEPWSEDAVIFGHSWLCLEVVPPYSTEVSAAWEVVERLRQAGWIVRITEMPDGFPFRAGSGWDGNDTPIHRRVACSLHGSPALKQTTGRDVFRPIWGLADVAPEAVCRAALKALTGEGGVAMTFTGACWRVPGGRVRHRRRTDSQGRPQPDALCGVRQASTGWIPAAIGDWYWEMPDCRACERRAAKEQDAPSSDVAAPGGLSGAKEKR